MKRNMIWIMLGFLLSGCAAEPVYETIGNPMDQSEPAAIQGTIDFALPEGAQMEVMEGEIANKRYMVGDWEIWTHVYPGGDIQSTLEQVTGLTFDALTVVEQKKQDFPSYETVWSSTGEDGTMVGRTAVLDDGNYHYCISVSVPERDAEEVEDFFSQILNSVTITDTAP